MAMTREEKRINKEHCKNMPWDIKLQCWFYRNRDEIVEIVASIIGAILGAIVGLWLKTIL